MGRRFGKKMDDTFENYRSYALTAAKELYYGKDVISRIEQAKNEFEIERILIQARKGSGVK